MKNFKNLTNLINKPSDEYTQAERYIIRAYHAAQYRNCDTLVFDSIVWDKDIVELIDTLKANNVKSFYYCIGASGQVGILAAIINNGYKLAGSTEVPEHKHQFNEPTTETGLVFKLTK